METNKSEKKKGLEINENYDFNFAVKLNPTLRWILVLPMGIAGLLMLQLGGGWIVGFLLRSVAEDSILAIVVNALFGVVKYFIFLMAMVATAPVARQNKFRTGLVLALIPFSLPFAFARLALNFGDGVDSTMMALNVGMVAVGIFFALMSIRSEIKKPLPELREAQEEIRAQDPVNNLPQ